MRPVSQARHRLTPVKFGISFTATHLNQAGALLHIYTDGTVHINHGGTEMGQGLFTKVAQVVAGGTADRYRPDQDHGVGYRKVPNASATAASSGSDLNGKAAQAAARKIRKRLVTRLRRNASAWRRARSRSATTRCGSASRRWTFAEFVRLAWIARTSLSATGFYRTPKIHYDRATFSGPAVLLLRVRRGGIGSVVDTLTGEYRLLRVDILHDCGRSLNPAIDMGQIEGGFIQGAGWLTSEELWWDADGALRTHAPSTYKIPTCSDLPVDFRVEMLESAANREDTIYRSKAVGEPPLMLSLSVFHAIRDAVASLADYRKTPPLDAPATPEAVLMAIEALRQEEDPA
jgi:xanthine dehydrogenase large subunit